MRRRILDRGAAVDLVDRFGRTPLHHAAAGGEVRIVEYLVVLMADIHVQDAYGDTPVHVAASNGNPRVVDFILSWQEERLRRYTTGKDAVKGVVFDAAARKVFRKFLRERLSPYQAQRFSRSWLYDACVRLYEESDRQPLMTVAVGE